MKRLKTIVGFKEYKLKNKKKKKKEYFLKAKKTLSLNKYEYSNLF